MCTCDLNRCPAYHVCCGVAGVGVSQVRTLNFPASEGIALVFSETIACTKSLSLSLSLSLPPSLMPNLEYDMH